MYRELVPNVQQDYAQGRVHVTKSHLDVTFASVFKIMTIDFKFFFLSSFVEYRR